MSLRVVPTGLLCLLGLCLGSSLRECFPDTKWVLGAGIVPLLLLRWARFGTPGRIVLALVLSACTGMLRSPPDPEPMPAAGDSLLVVGEVVSWRDLGDRRRVGLNAVRLGDTTLNPPQRISLWAPETWGREPEAAWVAALGSWSPDVGPTNPGMWVSRSEVGAFFPLRGTEPEFGPGAAPREVVWAGRGTQRLLDRPGGFPGRLAAAMTFGRSDLLTSRDREALQRTGTSHLVAVSGLHVGLIALMLGLLASGTPAMIRWGLILLGVWTYALLSGLPPSALRAAMMITLFGLSRLLLRPRSTVLLFSGALPWLVWLDPELMYQVSFRLSAGAVAGILLVADLARAPRWLSPVMASLGAQWGTLCSSLTAFGTVSPLALLPNLLAVPLAGVFLPAVMLSLIAPEAWGMAKVGALIAGALSVLIGQAANLLPFLAHRPPPLRLLELAPVMCFALWFTLPATLRARGQLRVGALSVLAALAVAMLIPRGVPPGPWIAFLDVGQGDATVMRLRDGTIWIVDVGDDRGGLNARRTLVPFLRQQGIRHVDGLILSHLHRDHVGGLHDLFQAVTVDRVYDTGQGRAGGTARWVDRVLTARARIPCVVGAGDTLYANQESVLLAVGPARPAPGEPGIHDPNLASLVVRVDDGPLTAVFAGDAEVPAEVACLDSGLPLQATFLQVGHHGSDTSSSTGFVEAVDPSWAIISCGRRNSYGHPGARAMDNLQRPGTRVYRTDHHGAIIFSWNDDTGWRSVAHRPRLGPGGL